MPGTTDNQRTIDTIWRLAQRVCNKLQRSSVKIMNVCGGHERTISKTALRQVLPESIELIPGPGCPVCVCPERDLFQALQLAQQPNVILVTYGDMLRVPLNLAVKHVRTLEQARATGARVKAIATPMQAVQIANDNPDKAVVFFAIGFETTAAPTAAMILQGLPDNLFILMSSRLTWPAVKMLLDSDRPGFDALIAPGHVATIMGAAQWEFVARDFSLPVAVAGFEQGSLLQSIAEILAQLDHNAARLANSYAQAVTAEGNQYAQRCLDQVFTITSGEWRGIGTINESAFELNSRFQHRDAKLRWADEWMSTQDRVSAMPPGCDCAQVVLGKIYPDQCRLFATGCSPQQPMGPCMVSEEGACRIWYSNQGGYRSSSSQHSSATASRESAALKDPVA